MRFRTWYAMMTAYQFLGPGPKEIRIRGNVTVPPGAYEFDSQTRLILEGGFMRSPSEKPYVFGFASELEGDEE